MSTPSSGRGKKPLKWVTYDHELENTAELREAGEAVPSRSNVRFLSHEAPNEKNEEFRRTVRMHVMRDYRQRMREAAGASGSARSSSATRAKSPKRRSSKGKQSRSNPRSSPAINISPPTHTMEYDAAYGSDTSISSKIPHRFEGGYDSADSDDSWYPYPSQSQQDVAVQGYLSHLNYSYGYESSALPSSSQSPGLAPAQSDPYANLSYTPGAQALLTHFDGFARSIFPYLSENNPLQTKFLPLVYESSGAQCAVLALCAAHLGNFNGDRAMNIESLSHRRTAIALLKKSLGQMAMVSGESNHRQRILDTAIVTAFFIGCHDHIDGGTAVWDMRMGGMAHLVALSGGPSALGFDGTLEQLFTWGDVFSSTLTLSTPLQATLPGYVSGDTNTRSNQALWPSCHLFACPDSLISLISECAALAATIRPLSRPTTEALTASNSLERLLHYWTPTTDDRAPQVGSPASWERAWEAFRIAALLYLYTAVHRLRSSDATVHNTAARLFALLGNLDHDHEIEKRLLWVEFIAGTVAETPQQRGMIQSRMSTMAQVTGVGAWSKAIQVLGEMWQTGMSLWEAIMQAEKRETAYLFF